MATPLRRKPFITSKKPIHSEWPHFHTFIIRHHDLPLITASLSFLESKRLKRENVRQTCGDTLSSSSSLQDSWRLKIWVYAPCGRRAISLRSIWNKGVVLPWGPGFHRQALMPAYKSFLTGSEGRIDPVIQDRITYAPRS